MPTFYPEGDAAAPFDDPQRLLAKWAQHNLTALGDPGTLAAVYPEGCTPLPFDDEERLAVKVNAIRKGV